MKKQIIKIKKNAVILTLALGMLCITGSTQKADARKFWGKEYGEWVAYQGGYACRELDIMTFSS